MLATRLLQTGHINRSIGAVLRADGPLANLGTKLGYNLNFGRNISTINLERPTKPHFGLVIVPQQTVYIIERFGKYKKTIGAGLHLLWPKIDKISYVHSLKENTIVIPNQTAITKDNVGLIHVWMRCKGD